MPGEACAHIRTLGTVAPPQARQCDECVAIPMPPAVDSLNVASAAAVFFYEVRRQRGGM